MEPQKTNSHRHYDVQFKNEAVKQVNSGRSVPEVAKALGINESLLYQWCKKASIPNSSDAIEENTSLRKQVKQLEIERDILKKALAIFSRVC